LIEWCNCAILHAVQALFAWQIHILHASGETVFAVTSAQGAREMKFALCAAGLAAIVASSATAGLQIGDSVTLSRVSTSPTRMVTVNFDYSRTASASAVTGGTVALAGVTTFNVISVTTSGGTTTAGAGQMSGFCVEFAEAFVDDPIVYDIVPVTSVPEENPPGNMSANQAALMADLYSRSYAGSLDSGSGSWSDRQNNAAAFQLVVWEISHENFGATDLSGMQAELNIGLGAFQVTDATNGDSAAATAVAELANNMIAALGSGGWNQFGALVGATNGSAGSVDNQDFLFVVPSPAIAGLAGLGLVGMRRRRR
jgi:hypothetical protein